MQGIIFHIPTSITFCFLSAFILQIVPIPFSLVISSLPFYVPSYFSVFHLFLHLFHIYTKMYMVLHMKKIGDDTILIVMVNIIILADSKIAGKRFSE